MIGRSCGSVYLSIRSFLPIEMTSTKLGTGESALVAQERIQYRSASVQRPLCMKLRSKCISCLRNHTTYKNTVTEDHIKTYNFCRRRRRGRSISTAGALCFVILLDCTLTFSLTFVYLPFVERDISTLIWILGCYYLKILNSSLILAILIWHFLKIFVSTVSIFASCFFFFVLVHISGPYVSIRYGHSFIKKNSVYLFLSCYSMFTFKHVSIWRIFIEM
jgi:hypothetical protein